MTRKDEWRRQRAQILSLSAYDRHKQLVNDYMLFFPGATKLILQVNNLALFAKFQVKCFPIL